MIIKRKQIVIADAGGFILLLFVVAYEANKRNIYLYTSLVIILLALALVSFLLRGKPLKKKSGHNIVIIWVILILSAIILEYLPFENAFYRFDSAENAYTYRRNEDDILETIEGKDTVFILYANGDDYAYDMVIKDERGWKLTSGLQNKKHRYIESPISVTTLKNPYSDQVLISVTYIKYSKTGDFPEIHDNRKSVYYVLNKERDGNVNTIQGGTVVQKNDKLLIIAIGEDMITIQP